MKKLTKENEFLQNRVESLDLQISELKLKKEQGFDDDDNTPRVDDLAEMDDEENNKD